ncbi:hypothetical protein [Cohnella abietis]|uniref:Holin n=1 Tax=Cohnella abietis TaxID=2507935 RepID=A0A3T1D8V6_9BACL|nr:hypothetical protein [Cohnella abietis]BBI34504.1 hypothetical protein KCTCHS21_39030 [Cohnella abietis]
MSWSEVVMIWLLGGAIGLMEQGKLKGKLKEKVLLLSLIGACYAISLALVWVHELPGPTQWIDTLYKPLGKLLEK